MRKVFLEKLPRQNGCGGQRIDWKKSVGHKVSFIYDDIKSFFTITNYINNKNRVTILYNDQEYNIFTGNLKYCKIGKILGVITKAFKIEIGENIKDEHRDMLIIDRKYQEKIRTNKKEQQKWYKYHCNRCGNEDWIIGYSLLNNQSGCNICCPTPRKAKLGINTIWDTDRWMCNLGVSEEDAKRYSHGSTNKITVKCPDCGMEKEITVSTIYNYKSIGCHCGDGRSYPEKFVVSILEQLKIDFETEYKPKWSNGKRYDFYMPKLNCIIETHGLQHYKDSIFEQLGGRTLKEEKGNDEYKKEKALSNGIKSYIELDCRESNLEYIKGSIINSELSKLFDLNNINWLKCAEFANKNIIKEVCFYWNNKKEDETTSDLGRIFRLSKDSIKKYLLKGRKLGWCNYNPKEEMRKVGGRNGKKSGKKVEVFKNGKSLGIFDSLCELERKSEELFGVKLLNECISLVCKGKQKLHKGYYFRYI